MKTTYKLLRFLKPFVWEICLSVLLGIATIGSGIGLLGTSAFLIASAALHPSIADLQVSIVGVRFFGISRAGFRYLERLVSHSVNLRVLSRLREWFYDQVEASPPEELHSRKVGDLLNRVMGDLETLENFYVRVVSPVVVAVVVSAGVSMFMGIFDARLGLILVTGLAVNGILLPILSILLTRPLAKKMLEMRSDLSSRTVEWLQGLEVLQSSGSHTRWAEAILIKGREGSSWQTRISTLNGINSGLSLLLLNVTVLALMWVAIPLVTQGSITGVSLAVFLLMGMASFESVAGLPQAAVMLNASLEAGKRLFELGERQETNKSFESLPESWTPSHVEVRGLCFEYSAEENFQLKEISFTLKPSTKIALVGSSGAGKTSLINLILQFWKPQEGSIFLDQMESSRVDPYRVRSNFALISQSTTLFSASLRENLLLGNPQADDQQLLEVLKLAELEDWFSRLPQGFETWIGDQGLRLSGGERQRVAIARALLQNRPYLLLDEPVENLDPTTRKKIMTTLFNLFSDRGILFITHDFAWLDQVDEILLLQNGIILERGTLKELEQSGGRYSELIVLQNQSLD
ncbi:MAG: thiol reductant ABC exporter subunit CydC [Chloroflexi bacterium HGW-Chloroflexi-4]|nr:MAG: thiol reductant ABC exporter subunit CydC [Chloroflexi bacterium HGW-Chloroflexi-4]